MIARLPCFATGTPAAATTSEAAVEMLNVPLPSPPVPTRSIVPGGASTRTTRSRIAPAKPGQLVGGLAAHPERDEEGGQLGGGRLAVHDRAHRAARLVDRQGPAVDDRGERGPDRVAHRTAVPVGVAGSTVGSSLRIDGPGVVGRLGHPAVANEPATSSSRAASPSPARRRKLARRCGPSGVRTDFGVELDALERQRHVAEAHDHPVLLGHRA